MVCVLNVARIAVLVVSALCLPSLSVGVTSAGAETRDEMRERINENAVTILSGDPSGTYLFIADDMSNVLDKSDEMRVIPMVGKGGAQNLRDLIFLRGVDMAIVPSNALDIMSKAEGFEGLPGELRYIARLYDEELHLLARKDITSLEQLAGKRVNTSDLGSGSQMTARDILDKLAIAFEEVNLSQRDAIEKLKAGELDATFLIAGKPSRAWQDLEIDRERFHLLAVPWSEALQGSYLPARLTHEDYPNLLSPGESIDTVASGAVLAVYNWKKGTERYKRLARFVEAFFSQVKAFQDPARHPKWRETNLAAALPGWTRFVPAEEWLRRNNVALAGEGDLKGEFEAFLAGSAAGMSETEKDALFDQFLQWRQSKDGVAASDGGVQTETR